MNKFYALATRYKERCKEIEEKTCKARIFFYNFLSGFEKYLCVDIQDPAREIILVRNNLTGETKSFNSNSNQGSINSFYIKIEEHVMNSSLSLDFILYIPKIDADRKYTGNLCEINITITVRQQEGNFINTVNGNRFESTLERIDEQLYIYIFKEIMNLISNNWGQKMSLTI